MTEAMTGGSLRRLALVVLVIAVVVAIFGILTRSHSHALLEVQLKQANTIYVDVVQPHAGGAAGSNDLVLPANVQPYTDASIYARSSGYVRHWYADIGQHVTAGQLLADIETPEVDAQRRQAQADLATAQANNAIAQTTARRYQSLKQSGLVAQQDVDTNQSTADARQAALASARENLRHADQLQAFSRVTAPFDGVVTARHVDVGSLVTAGGASGQELFHLTALRRLRVYVQVPQMYAAQMHDGMEASMTFAAQPDKSYPVKLVRSAGALDANTRTLLTEFEADNADGKLLSGSFAQLRLALPTGAAALRLPSNTLLFRGDGLHVGTVDSAGHVSLAPVSLGRDFGNEVEILGGISPGDRVIINPPDSLIAGTVVNVNPPH